MHLKCNEKPTELRIWAIPDIAQKFKDDLIIMIKDNPIPVILPIICQGSKPKIDIIECPTVIFERLLLNQSCKKTMKLKNVCEIPVLWKLNGEEALPHEFAISKTSGQLEPCEETTIDISFTALKQNKFDHKLMLEVKDIEGLNIKQELKQIPIEAEGFEVSVDFKFPSPDNLLDFGAVKVGEQKDQQFNIKNIGKYKIKYSFSMKKKIYRDCFKIEPTEGELEANQEKTIIIKFLSKKELKLKTSGSTTDIFMEILEGKTLELVKPVPINVAVNAVFSKYSISPFKSINFGPIPFNESKSRTFEIKNEGIFEFGYTILEYQSPESKLSPKEEPKIAIAKEKEKEKPKKDEKKPPAPPKKEDKKKPGESSQLKIGNWTISPCSASIVPDGSAQIEVVFTGKCFISYFDCNTYYYGSIIYFKHCDFFLLSYHPSKLFLNYKSS